MTRKLGTTVLSLLLGGGIAIGQSGSAPVPENLKIRALITGSVNRYALSGACQTTLADGWGLSLFDLLVGVGKPWAELEVNPLEFAFHRFRLNAAESAAISKYSVVTKQNGVTTKVEPLDKVTGMFYRLAVFLRFQRPENEGYLLFRKGDPSLRPFVGLGAGFTYLTTSLPVEGVTTQHGLGLCPFLRWGLDVAGHERRGEYIFCRVECSYGQMPDWKVSLLPELRPIREGRYLTVRLGLGFVIHKTGRFG